MMQWSTIGNISTGFALLAFVAAAVAAAYRAWVKSRINALKQLPPEDRLPAVTQVLNTFGINAVDLTKDQAYQLAVKELQIKARRYTLVAIVVVSVSAMFAVLAFYTIHVTRSPASESNELVKQIAELSGQLVAERNKRDALNDQLDRLRTRLEDAYRETTVLARTNREIDKISDQIYTVLGEYDRSAKSPVTARDEKIIEEARAAPEIILKYARPVAYRIRLTPDLTAFQILSNELIDFRGEEEVDIEVLRRTNRIALNALHLTFDRVSVGGLEAKIFIDTHAQTAIFQFPQQLTAGSHTLKIIYSGRITKWPEGIYYHNYDSSEGQRRILLTQLEATDARRVFACWDDPASKASFTLSIVLPEQFTAVSNMPGHVTWNRSGAAEWRFEATPKMSTYLVGILGGELDRMSRKIAAVDIGVMSPRGQVEQGSYALAVAAQVLPYYNEYFGIRYPLPKLDIVAVPDFEAIAMENWGAIFVDSRSLLLPTGSSQETRERTFAIVAHEIAHQWFGNLVSMAWWDDLWLTEGFPRWMEKKAADRFNPHWRVGLRSHDQREEAMTRDAYPATRSLRLNISDVSQIASAFNSPAYVKGESIIRMIEGYLGEETFREGVRAYMSAHKYSNASSADFWATLEKTSGKPVVSIVNGFIDYPGIPSVDLETNCTRGRTHVTLRQGLFAFGRRPTERRFWVVPVTLGTIDNGTRATLLVGEQPVTLEFEGCDSPVKANLGDTGYYRVHYGAADFQVLAANYQRLDSADRVNLLADTWAMVEAGRADAKDFLALAQDLSRENELAVSSAIIKALQKTDDLERGSPGRSAFRAYACRLLNPVLDRLGWEPKPEEASQDPHAAQLRSLVITTLGRFGDMTVINEARSRFASFVRDPTTLHPDLRSPVATVVGHVADRDTFDTLHAVARRQRDYEERLMYYHALVGARSPALIVEAVKIALNDLPRGRIRYFLSAAARTSDDPDTVWKLLFDQREEIRHKLPGADWWRLLPQVARSSFSSAVADELKNAAMDPTVSQGARDEAERAIEEIEFKVELRSRLLPAVDIWVAAAQRSEHTRGERR